MRSAQARCSPDPRLLGLRARGWRVLAGRLMGTLGAGTRPPVNFSRHSRPEPKPLLAASCAAVKRLLPCSGVGGPSLIRDQADSLVLDGGEEARLSFGPWTTKQQCADETDQALHEIEYGRMKRPVNERLRRSVDQRQVCGVMSGQSSRAQTVPIPNRVTEYHQSLSSAPLASGWRATFGARWGVRRGDRGPQEASGSNSGHESPTHLNLGLRRVLPHPRRWIISKS